MSAREPETNDAVSERASSAETATPHWEEIAPGRFQPRRTRGSYPGRELG